MREKEARSIKVVPQNLSNLSRYCIVCCATKFLGMFLLLYLMLIASQLFVCPETVRRTISTFLNTGDVKPCNIGRPTVGASL